MLSEALTKTTLSNSDWYYQIRKDVEDKISVQNRFFSFCRGLDYAPKGESHKYEYLVEFFVNEITGPYDQDISFLLVGNKGRGKSLAALSISFYTACELAERLGGKWQDYFNPDTNMAVILEEEANNVMKIQEKYQCKNYDDIGIGWGARNWQNQDNKDKNDVFQINRTDNTLQIFSVPNQFLLDKVPRSLVSHYGEMAQQFFAHGFTTIKIFEPETLFREGKIIQPYLNVERSKYVLFRIPKPPDDLVTYYKKRRKANKELATKSRLDDTPEDMKPPKPNANITAMEQNMMEYAEVVMPVIRAGGSRNDLIEVLMGAGLEKAKAKRWTGSKAFARLFPKTS
jgi:hypothetical protein